MDKKLVFILMGIILVVGSIFLYLWISQGCVQPEISSDLKNVNAGDKVTFTCSNIKGKTIIWDFGDNDTLSASNVAFHAYKAGGTFSVTAKVKDNCESEPLAVVVTDVPKMHKVKPNVALPLSIHAGESVTFTDNTDGARQWSWSIKGIKEKGDTTKSFTHIFKAQGTYYVSLILLGDYVTGTDTYTITVLPKEKPHPNGPSAEDIAAAKERKRIADEAREKAMRNAESKKHHYLSDAEFKARFIGIVDSIIHRNTRNQASDDFKNVIMPEGGIDSSFNVTVKFATPPGKLEDEMDLTLFKRNCIYSQYKDIKAVEKITRSKESINKITIIVDGK